MLRILIRLCTCKNVIMVQMDNEIKDVLIRFKQETNSNNTCETTYPDQTVCYADVGAVNRCIPYILRDVLMENGDSVHELAPVQNPTPFYAWFRGNQCKSVGIYTVPGDSVGTTTIQFKLLEVESQEQLLHELVLPFFTRQAQPSCMMISHVHVCENE